MQDIKVELLKLHDSLNEEQFDGSDIFSSFCNIWKLEEAKNQDEFDEDTVTFVNQVQDAPFVDTENLKEMHFEDIKQRLEVILDFL